MDLNKVLTIARQALADNKLDVAIKLLSAASRNHADAPEVYYYLGTALGKQGGQDGSCCLCFLRTLQLLGPQPDNKGHQLMAAVAADNCWLMASSSLPQAWPSATVDAALQTRFSTAAAHITRQAMQQAMAAPNTNNSTSGVQEEDPKYADSESHVQLLVVGGLGVQAMQLAAAASNVQDQLLRSSQQQQGAAVPSMALSYVPSDSLTAQLASQLFADNDLDDIIDVCSWTELRQQQQESSSSSINEAAAGAAVSCAALLAGVVQPNWSNAVAACLSACRGLVGLISSSSRDQACVLSPACIRIWAVPVSCKDLLNLNEVDLQEIAQQTAGSYNYAAANAALRRSSRPCQVSRFGPQLLADPVVVLELKPQQLLQQLQQHFQPRKQHQQQGQGQQTIGSGSGNADVACASASDASATVAAALCSAASAAASTAVQLHTSGRLDCIVWWLEFQLSPGCSVSYAPAAAAGRAGGTSSSSSSSSTRRQLDVLRPHAWQHVQYLPIQQQQQQQQAGDESALAAVCYQGQHVTAGQQVLLQLQASVDQLTLSLFNSSSSSSVAAASDGLCSLQQQVAQLSVQQQQEGAGHILPYHLSMLNDHARTRAYDQGIAAAVQELLQQQQQQLQDGAAVVLDVGCGTGLLSMMAATAAAAAAAAAGNGDAVRTLQVVACEREPPLAAVAQQLVAAHGMQQQVAVHQKLSSQLSLAAMADDKPAAAAAEAASTSGKTDSNSSTNAAELPARAALVVHEIFGTDPLSEHVLPALRQVQQQLAAPGAKLVPRAIRVIAAVASCPALQQQLRLPQQPNGVVPFDVSSLLPLQPRRVELQLDDMASQLQLLTRPASVLEFDFEQDWPLRLNGQVDVQLPALETGLLLSTWMELQQLQPQGQNVVSQHPQQQQQGLGGLGLQAKKRVQQKVGTAAAAAAASCKELCVVSWFEADCGAGGWLSTAPGTTKYGHWQQSVEFVAVPPAATAVAAAVLGGGLSTCAEDGDEEGEGSGSSSSGSFNVCVSWAVDRLKFSLAE